MQHSRKARKLEGEIRAVRNGTFNPRERLPATRNKHEVHSYSHSRCIKPKGGGGGGGLAESRRQVTACVVVVERGSQTLPARKLVASQFIFFPVLYLDIDRLREHGMDFTFR